jgi:hypothetical protein
MRVSWRWTEFKNREFYSAEQGSYGETAAIRRIKNWHVQDRLYTQPATEMLHRPRRLLEHFISRKALDESTCMLRFHIVESGGPVSAMKQAAS